MRSLAIFCLAILLSISVVYAQDVQGDVYVEASVVNPNPYVGQQIIYNFKLYDAVGLTNPLYLPSDFEGFWRIDIGVVSQTSELINGRSYNVTTISTALYPTHSGTITIKPSRVVLPETVFRSKETLTANPVSLDVKALPESNSTGFSGGVGQFRMSATLDRQTAKVGEPVVMTLTVTGTGNVEQLPPPTIPDNWRATINTGSFTSAIQNGLVAGTLSYQIVFIPVKAGTQELPSITVDYFDPDGANYKSLSTSAIPIEVSGDPLVSPNTSSDTSEPSLRLKPIENISVTDPDTNPIPILIAILVPFCATLIVAYQRQRKIWMRENQAKTRRQQALQVARRSLQGISLDDSRASYQLIDTVLMEYVADKLNTDLEKVKQTDLVQFLSQHETPESVISKVRTLNSEIDEGLFAPSSDFTTPQRRDEMLSLLSDIDNEWVTQ